MAQLRLIRVDTGEIVLAIPYRTGRVARNESGEEAGKTGRAGRNRLPGKLIRYSFTKEKDITENWDITGEWRMENGALLLKNESSMRSKQMFNGDFIIEVEGSGETITLDMWGEQFVRSIAKGRARWVRKGNNVTCFCPDEMPKVVTLKAEQLTKASPIQLRHYGPLTVATINVIGTVAEPAAEKAGSK